MMIRTQILFPRDVLMDLREIAIEEKMSVSQVIRVLAVDTIKKKKKKKLSGIEVLRYMAKHAYKGSVPKDASTNDEYLYGRNAP